MILKALADYYERLKEDGSSDIPPYGFEDKPIPFIIVLNKQGKFQNIIDTRTGEGKNRRAREYRLPQGEKKTSGIKENLLWDNPQYVLGKPKSDNNKDVEKAKEALDAFKKRIIKDLSDLEDDGVKALISFYESEEISAVSEHALFKDLMEENANTTFMLDGGKELIAQRPLIYTRIAELYEKNFGQIQVSAISGKKDAIAILHTAIKGVWGAKTTGANIVSFNDDAYCSYGRTKSDQGLNAPIGKHEEFAYTTALNHLLASEKQRMQVGDASTVFWARDSCGFEEDFHSFLAPSKGEESVSYNKIRGLLSSVKTGIPPQEAKLPFYVLGLAPNASRIAVRFWYEGNVKEIKERVAQHFQDLEMLRAPADPEYLSLYQMLISTVSGPDRKAEKIPPNLGGEVLQAVLNGILYPRTLFSNTIRRCKAEQSVEFEHAAIIKAFLIRRARFTKSTQKEVSMALDTKYDNIGYVLGRLLALLVKVQEEAHKPQRLDKTIRDTYFSAAASSPQIIFKRLLDLSIHHLAKIRNTGRSTVWLEILIQEIISLIPAFGIPTILSLEDQGRFSIGYYHQWQDFFNKKESITNEGEEE